VINIDREQPLSLKLRSQQARQTHRGKGEAQLTCPDLTGTHSLYKSSYNPTYPHILSTRPATYQSSNSLDLPPELFQPVVGLIVKMPYGVVGAWKARRACSENNAASDSPPSVSAYECAETFRAYIDYKILANRRFAGFVKWRLSCHKGRNIGHAPFDDWEEASQDNGLLELAFGRVFTKDGLIGQDHPAYMYLGLITYSSFTVKSIKSTFFDSVASHSSHHSTPSVPESHTPKCSGVHLPICPYLSCRTT
jgi:hypothetical protein